MRHTLLLLLLLAPLLGSALEPTRDEPASQPAATETRFGFVDVYIDPKGHPLAAYQFELTAQGADVTLIGVEGGEHPAYVEPPYYDPKANLQNRIIIGAFNTGEQLPRQRTRVARLMVRARGAVPPRYSARLDVAASPDSQPIAADIQVSEGAAP